jgi:aldehyde:ferredoxin oxidoreductase
LREGYNPLNNINTISGRIFGNEPLKDGPNKGINIDVQAMIQEYLAYADWDPVTTIPSREKLISLNLKEVADFFY